MEIHTHVRNTLGTRACLPGAEGSSGDTSHQDLCKAVRRVRVRRGRCHSLGRIALHQRLLRCLLRPMLLYMYICIYVYMYICYTYGVCACVVYDDTGRRGSLGSEGPCRLAAACGARGLAEED